MKDSRVKDLIDEFQELARARYLWEKYWRDISRYVLPQTSQFENMLSSNPMMAISAVVDTPTAAQNSKDVYDMTSLWGVERLSAGLLTLKTPESTTWHNMNVDSDFGYDPSHEEQIGLEAVRDYLFKVRSNPRSGFWSAHKAAVRSMCAFGDGWMFVEELLGSRLPYQYQYMPLPEMFPGVGVNGQPNRMFRVFAWSAAQIAEKWRDGIAGSKVEEYANDPTRRHTRFKVMHAVKPADDVDRGQRMGVYGGKFSSWYCLPDEEHVLAKGGFFEFPFHRYAWSNNGIGPYCEGPVALALGEIKSLNEMAKNELIAVQALIRPALAVHGKNFNRINFNPGAVNPGLMTGDGNPLFQPINGGVRPDFAKLIMDQRRGALRELLYLNMWQILLDSPEKTATEALIRAQEKGELLGPVGISMNEGLSQMVDREVGIIDRKGAFKPGSPLELPESLYGREVAPQFTSPLDRLRRYGELVGMQRMLEMIMPFVEVRPELLGRIDFDEMIDTSAEILGVPIKVLVDKAQAQKNAAPAAQAANVAGGMQMAQAGGEAMKALGEGGQALTTATEQASAAPNVQRILQQISSAGAPQ